MSTVSLDDVIRTALEQLSRLRAECMGDATLARGKDGRPWIIDVIDRAARTLESVSKTLDPGERTVLASEIASGTPRGKARDGWEQLYDRIDEPVRAVRAAAMDLLWSPEAAAFLSRAPARQVIQMATRLRRPLPHLEECVLRQPPLATLTVAGRNVTIFHRDPESRPVQADGLAIDGSMFLCIPIAVKFLAVRDPYLVVAVPLTGGPPWPIVVDAAARASSAEDDRFWKGAPAFRRLGSEGVEMEWPDSTVGEWVPYATIRWQPLEATWRFPSVPQTIHDMPPSNLWPRGRWTG